MNKLQIAFIAMMLNLFPSDSVLAEGEAKEKSVKTPVLNGAKKRLGPHSNEIEIKIRNAGEQIIVETDFVVPVTPEEAWAVLTDFDNIAKFNSGILSSKVTDKVGNTLKVSQKAVTKYGFLTFSYESVREIQLFPFLKIQERMINGSMRKMEETTQLLGDGGQTRITYHAVFVPSTRVPPMVGNAFIKHEAREQFQQIANEIIRRNHVKLAGHE